MDVRSPKPIGGTESEGGSPSVLYEWSDEERGGEKEITGVRGLTASGVFDSVSVEKDDFDFCEQTPVSGVLRLVSDREVVEQKEVVPSYVEDLARLYEEICRVPMEDAALMELHDLFMDSLYSRRLLPLMAQINNYGIFDTERENGFFQKALKSISVVMESVREHADYSGVSKYEAFLDLYDQSVTGNNVIVSQMVEARNAAIVCITQVNNVIGDGEFIKMANLVVEERRELDEGLMFPESFYEKLVDPLTKAVVVSLDFNSTFNYEESYAHPELVAGAQRAFSRFALEFRRAFPEKELYLAINTGRPGMYAWGVAEAGFLPMNEFRKVAVGESGGVVLKEGLNEGAMEVAVEHPREWKMELDGLKDYLLRMVNDAQSVVIEPKMSMLSIRVAREGKFIHKANGHEEVNAKWIQEMVERYLKHSYESALSEYRVLLMRVEDKVVADHLVNTIKDLEGGKNFLAIIQSVRPLLQTLPRETAVKLEQIESRIKTLEEMYVKRMLQTKYNPTAGYVDIGHAELNKFSTLAGHVCRENGVGRENILFVQIGDSPTDIIPTTLTGKGEPNEGAEGAFSVAVANCSPKLRESVLARGERGIFTVNKSVLGATGFARGLLQVVKEVRRRR